MDLAIILVMFLFLITVIAVFAASYQLFIRVYSVGYKAGAQELLVEKNEPFEFQAEDTEEPEEVDDKDNYTESIKSYYANI